MTKSSTMCDVLAGHRKNVLPSKSEFTRATSYSPLPSPQSNDGCATPDIANGTFLLTSCVSAFARGPPPRPTPKPPSQPAQPAATAPQPVPATCACPAAASEPMIGFQSWQRPPSCAQPTPTAAAASSLLAADCWSGASAAPRLAAPPAPAALGPGSGAGPADSPLAQPPLLPGQQRGCGAAQLHQQGWGGRWGGGAGSGAGCRTQLWGCSIAGGGIAAAGPPPAACSCE
ncbi:hypothetical protein V8C86DRAFT_2527019 [Haematococcus lacustris]